MLIVNFQFRISYKDYGVEKIETFYTLTYNDRKLLYVKTPSVIQYFIDTIDRFSQASVIAVMYLRNKYSNISDVEILDIIRVEEHSTIVFT